jgi:hypothetical protein
MASARGRRRAQNDSKLATTFRAVVFFAMVAAVVFGTRPLWHDKKSSHPTAQPGASSAAQAGAGGSGKPLLDVRYRTGTRASASVSQPWLQIVNVSAKNVALGSVTLRYYYTQEGGHAYAANCIFAEIGCSHLSERIVALPAAATGADHYLEVSFTADAGTLKPLANSGAIELQLYRPGGAALNEANDYSYDKAATKAYGRNTHITAYLDGAPAWGQAPAGVKEKAPGSSTRPATTGVLFDNFHYSGPADPALNQHGWVVRTSSGGPGVLNTWKSSGVSFPAVRGAQGGQVLNLRATTDGTRSGTTQAEVQSVDVPFFTGTYAARIHFTDHPTKGTNGDPINEDFYMISPRNDKYSEIDAEYEPNGGWGAPGPRLDTTTWHNASGCGISNSAASTSGCDRTTQKNMISLEGWHTLVITAADGVVTYSMDGKVLYTTSGKYYPREPMSANFNTWFVDLKEPISGTRQWDMQINWFYYNSTQALSLSQVQTAVGDLYTSGTNYLNTIKKK